MCFFVTPSSRQMSTSGGAGYCDCGDVEAWKSEPFCDIHKRGAARKDKECKVSDCRHVGTGNVVVKCPCYLSLSNLVPGIKRMGQALYQDKVTIWDIGLWCWHYKVTMSVHCYNLVRVLIMTIDVARV